MMGLALDGFPQANEQKPTPKGRLRAGLPKGAHQAEMA